MSRAIAQAGAGDVMPIIVVGLVLGLALVLTYAIWAAAGRRRAETGARLPSSFSGPAGKERFEAGERRASIAAEAIEELVRERLRRHPDLAAVSVDFGTGPGGELEIWVGEECFGSVEEIRDVRIRQAVAEAVEAFNR